MSLTLPTLLEIEAGMAKDAGAFAQWFRTRVKFADDPIIRLPDRDGLERALRETPRELLGWLNEREAKIRQRNEEPYKYGYEAPIWHVVDDLLVRGHHCTLICPVERVPKEMRGRGEVFISGANRSSKTEFAASRVVRKLVNKDRARAWAFHTTGPTSIAMQQPRIWKYLPAEWRAIRKHAIADIKYSQKNGFAGITPTFVGPNGSQCWFKNYAQKDDTIEGEELDIAWLDELAPIDTIETVRYRLADRKGDLIITFTPKDGYTPTVAMLTEGAKTIVQAPAPLLRSSVAGRADGSAPADREASAGGAGRMPTVPRVQVGKHPDLHIVYFHLADNPFAPAEEVVKKAMATGRRGIMERCYGVAEKMAGTRFPTFNERVHVVSRELIQKDLREGTNYELTDPCSGRNWFSIWVRGLPSGQKLIYRESPSPGQYIQGIGDPGWWAETDAQKHDGKKGDAQRPWGFGMVRNLEELLRLEGWSEKAIEFAIENCDIWEPNKELQGKRPFEEIFERLMDSRFGNAPTVQRNETKTLIDSLNELGMRFEPAPGEHQQEGIDKIHEMLYYDPEKPLSIDNRPELLISENCANVIFAFMNWTGLDGQHGACKDPIDLVRYAALRECEYLPADAFEVRGGGAY
jgi:hypothetical protein